MDVSIQRSTAFGLAVIAIGGGYLWLKGGPPKMPALPNLPGSSGPATPRPGAPASPAPTSPAPEAGSAPVVAPAAPIPATRTRTEAPVEAPVEGAPAKRERTPDEKARSLIAVAQGYAENGRYDLAYEKLEAAEALGASDDVQAEIRAATEAVTRTMRAARRR